MNLWKFTYNFFFLPLLWSLLKLGSFFNPKIRRGIEGRKQLFELLNDNIKKLHSPFRVWFHSSSLGEFEQAKPIIQAIKKNYPNTDVVATFFSPSGYEHSKNYKYANLISYLPFDSILNAERFIQIVNPTVAVMVRYDIWPNVVWKLQSHGIPAIIANATMQKKSLRKLFFVKQFHRALYSTFSNILTVSADDCSAFGDFGLTGTVIVPVGDTRYDQVIARAEEAGLKNILPQSITLNKKIFIVGQSWEQDEEIILPVLFKMHEQDDQFITIIVPHEPTIEHLEQLETNLSDKASYIRFSEINNYSDEKIILIDSVGILVSLYQYAHVVYIGGSFHQGIHNVLEPSVFGAPVIYGPKHTNSQEAVELKRIGGGFVVEDEKELYRILRTLFTNSELRLKAGKIAQSFVFENRGATDRILSYIEPYLKK
jgi:3-deoxy-D-manno-octulosonic-acid transferase